MCKDITKIKRLVKKGEINVNGYLYDSDTLNDQLNKFIEQKGEILLDNKTNEDLNKMLAKGVNNIDLEVIGKLVDYDDEYIYMKPLDHNIDFSGKKCNIGVQTSELKEEDGYFRAKIANINMVMIGDY